MSFRRELEAHSQPRDEVATTLRPQGRNGAATVRVMRMARRHVPLLFMPMRQAPLRVLIVEEDAAVGGLIERVLRRTAWKYEMVWARSRSEFFLEMPRFLPHLILLDLSAESEVVLCRYIRAFYGESRILCLSEALTEAGQKEVLNAGAGGVIFKPFKALALMRKVQSLFPWL